MDEGERVSIGTGREFVIGESASLTRKPDHKPFFAQTQPDAGAAGKAPDPGAAADPGEAGKLAEATAPAEDDKEQGEDPQTGLAQRLNELEIPPDDRPAYDAIGASISEAGASDSAIHQALAWQIALLERQRAGEELDEGGVLAQHKYKVSHRFDSWDVPYVNGFLNHMHDAEVPQADVDRILGWYKSHERDFASASIALRREVDALATQHRNDARAAMHGEWGDEYATNIRLINSYLDGLPDAERKKIEGEIQPDGRLALNDPARLRELAKLARGGGPGQSSKPPDEERAEIERFMRAHRQDYNKDARMQARYRDLISNSGDEPPANATQETDTGEANAGDAMKEYRDLQKFMCEHRQQYDRDPAKQARLRDLIDLLRQHNMIDANGNEIVQRGRGR